MTVQGKGGSIKLLGADTAQYDSEGRVAATVQAAQRLQVALAEPLLGEIVMGLGQSRLRSA